MFRFVCIFENDKMAIFEIDNGKAKRVRLSEFKIEKDLQRLVEENLETVFNCRFIASEFSTGNIHSGRIDTLAISEDLNPVIIEYKKVASSELINQSLYYLHWIKDHRGDFQIAANRTLNAEVEVDWSDIRVICLAPEYKKYDLHAVQVMGANIELWQYKIYENGILSIEEVYTQPSTNARQEEDSNGKNPMPKQGRDVRNIGHDGTGDFELTINNLMDFEENKELINESYKYIGG